MHLTLFGYIMATLEIISALVSVAYVNKPRPTITNGAAVFTCVWAAVMVACLLLFPTLVH